MICQNDLTTSKAKQDRLSPKLIAVIPRGSQSNAFFGSTFPRSDPVCQTISILNLHAISFPPKCMQRPLAHTSAADMHLCVDRSARPCHRREVDVVITGGAKFWRHGRVPVGCFEPVCGPGGGCPVVFRAVGCTPLLRTSSARCERSMTPPIDSIARIKV